MRKVNLDKNSRGFSLVELIVATLIGMVISIAALRSFMGSKEGFVLTQARSQMQESGRYATKFMGDAMTLAGFRGMAASPTDAFPAVGAFEAGQVVTGTDGADSSDTISVRYYGYDDGYNTDCQGNAVTSGVITVVEFSIRSNNLVCAVNGGTPEILVEGIEKLDVLYGVDQTGDGIVDTYLSADEVTLNDWWGTIRSTRLFVMAQALDDIQSVENDRRYFMAGTEYNFGDQRLREIFSSTVALRNLLSRRE